MSDLLTWPDKKNSVLLADFIAKHGAEYCLTAEEINQMRDAVNAMAVIQQSVFLGAAEPDDTPTGTGANYWEVIVPGTYTNFGGVVLPANNRGLIYRNEVGAFSISYAPLDLTEYVKNEDIVTAIDDYNIVFDPLFKNGIPSNVINRSGTSTIVDIDTPEGSSKAIRVTAVSNGDILWRIDNHGMVAGEKVTFSWLAHFDVLKEGWDVMRYDGGYLQLYGVVSVDLGAGWWRMSQEYTVNSAMAASSFLSGGLFLQSMFGNSFIYVTGFKVFVPDTVYDKLYLYKEVKQLKSDILIIPSLKTDIEELQGNSIVDNFNIVFDPLFINGIPANLVIGVGSYIIEPTSTPEGESNAVKITSATNGRILWRIDNHGLLIGEKITFSWLVKVPTFQVGWDILFYDGGYYQSYVPAVVDLGGGWYRYTKEFTIDAGMEASDFLQGGYFTPDMGSNTEILVTGFKVFVPKRVYDNLDLYVETKQLISDVARIKEGFVNVDVIPVRMWGDSLTMNARLAPQGYVYYPTYVQALLGDDYEVLNFGVGGENTQAIASRQGGYQLKVTNTGGITIPSTTTPVNLTISQSLLNQGESPNASVNPVTINGIQGALAKVSDGLYSFTRSVAGAAQFIPDTTPVFTFGQLNHRGGLLILGVGTNGLRDTQELRDGIIDTMKRMIEYSKCDDYAVVCPHSSEDNLFLLVEQIKEVFGGKAVDTRNLFTYEGVKYAVENGIIQEAIDNVASYPDYKHITSYSNSTLIPFTGVPSDYLTDAGVLADISNGLVPRIFMSDPTHFNISGMQLQAKFLYDRMKLLSL